MNDDETPKRIVAIGDAAEPAQRGRMRFVGEFPSEQLKKSLAGLEKFSALRLAPELTVPRIPNVEIPPNPAFRTNAEIEKLNGQMETLVGAMTRLATATVQMFWLTVAILFVALAGLALSIYLAFG